MEKTLNIYIDLILFEYLLVQCTSRVLNYLVIIISIFMNKQMGGWHSDRTLIQIVDGKDKNGRQSINSQIPTTLCDCT